MIAQIALGLTILVGLHEWGHMFAAKKFGMKVEKFSIGFPPKIFSKKIGETEYSFGLIPLGGFVKILGMIDESMDRDQMKKPPQPWEFRSKPAWQRLIVMLGGIIVNILLGITIYIGLTAYYGESYIPVENIKNGIYAGELAREIGLKTGDKIVKVNGKEIEDFEEAYSSDVFLDENSSYTIKRNNKELEVAIPPSFIEQLSDSKKGLTSYILPLRKFSVQSVNDTMSAGKAGMKAGDKIVKIGEHDIEFFEPFFYEHRQLYANKTAEVVVQRGIEMIKLSIELDSNGRLGFIPLVEDISEKREYSLLASIPIGTKKAFSIIIDNVKGFKKIFRGEVSPSKSVQGPIGIAKMFGGTWLWSRFWTIVGMLSMILAFMNLLPIPALDGGHVVFITFEMITGRKPSDKFMEYAQITGMIILLLLMVLIYSNDIVNNFIK